MNKLGNGFYSVFLTGGVGEPRTPENFKNRYLKITSKNGKFIEIFNQKRNKKLKCDEDFSLLLPK